MGRKPDPNKPLDPRLAEGYLYCERCGKKKMAYKDFFKRKDGKRDPICKECLTKDIDEKDPSTFKWILRRFDVPYIPDEWIKTYNREVERKGVVPKGVVLGKYLRIMKISQYKNKTFEESEDYTAYLLKEKEALQEKISNRQKREADLRAQLEAGTISQEEFNKLTGKTASLEEQYHTVEEEKQRLNFLEELTRKQELLDKELEKNNIEPVPGRPEIPEGPIPYEGQVFLEEKKEEEVQPHETFADERDQNPLSSISFKKTKQEKENEILNSLSEEEQTEMQLKWGTSYTPSQWLQMEEMYIEYENEYELNVDRKAVVKQICQVYVKMNEALALGDMSGYRSLASTYDSLRKSSKFTDAQNDEENQRYLDCIGELAKFCEQEKGLIEQLPNPDEYPQDKIDFTIKDIKGYLRNLVMGELGLGDIIESYVKKLEKAEEEREKDNSLLFAGVYESSEEEQEDALTEKEAESFYNYLDKEIEDEAAKLADLLGD